MSLNYTEVHDAVFEAIRDAREPRSKDTVTLRDYFAAAVLTGFMASKAHANFDPVDDANYCYKVADAMLAERTK